MKNVLKFGLAGIAALVLSSTLTNSTAQGRLIFDGVYNIAGTYPDGSTYTGTMTAVPYGDGYRLKQIYPSVTYNGVGNDIGDYFAGSYLVDGRPSISIYQVTAANTLTGFWQDYDQAKEGTETLTLTARAFSFVPSAPVSNTWNYAGTYGIRGDGYTATMVLSSFGDGYRATYVSGGNTWRGIASYIGKYLAISWNSAGAPGITLFEGNPASGDMSGFDMDYNTPKESLEVATRR